MLSESKFLKLYQRQQESGLTVKDFCSNEGIAHSTFYYWRKKFRNSRGANNFIPLVVKPSQTISHSNATHSLSEGSVPVDNFLLELVYSNGTILRIKKDIDLSHLRELISLYD
jgi:transposase-like protein